MSASARPHRPTSDHESANRSFLTSHRALAACSRELARLTEQLTHEVEELHAKGLVSKPVITRTPDRCILQLGPVALTLVWLRGTLDTAAAGELLVIGWRGSITPRPARTVSSSSRAASTPHELWEDVFVAFASGEADWRWRAKSGHGADLTSTELAAHSAKRLHDAYLECADVG